MVSVRNMPLNWSPIKWKTPRTCLNDEKIEYNAWKVVFEVIPRMSMITKAFIYNHVSFESQHDNGRCDRCGTNWKQFSTIIDTMGAMHLNCGFSIAYVGTLCCVPECPFVSHIWHCSIKFSAIKRWTVQPSINGGGEQKYVHNSIIV